MTMVDGTCKDFRHLLGAYADGELEPASLLTVEEHVTHCETCRERVALDRAFRASLKRVVRGEASAPSPARDAMRERMAAAMGAEATRGAAREEDAKRRARRSSASWRTIVPLASAATLALVWGAATRGPIARTTADQTVRGGLADDALLEELVSEHSNPLPPERTDPKDVRAFEQYVGVPVHTASFEKRAGARLVGGRLIPVNRARAAMLQYEIGQGAETRRVSVLIYDPHLIQVHGDELSPHAVGTAEVRVGRSNGYSVAVTQNGGVGYAVASDMDTDRSAQLAVYAEDGN